MEGRSEALMSGKVSIWWDIENCRIPKICKDPQKITCKILTSLRELGYSGRISIFAYGNSKILSKEVHQMLNSSGIVFVHVAPGKDAADKQMVNDMMLWARNNPPPASYLLISGDMDFLYALKKLKAREFEIMLAAQMFSYDTSIVADIVWDFNNLIQGGQPQQN